LVGANANQFVILGENCTGTFVAAGASCVVGVQFAPTVATALPVTASLSFTDNAAGSPHSVVLSGTGTGGLAAVAATRDQYGFPDWYQDENGVQVQPCLYTNGAADPNCVVLADPTFDPASPLAFPGPPLNFPGEYFYFVADSDKITTPGCPALGWAPRAAGAFTRVAMESSFVTGSPIPGDQISFARIRIVVKPNGLCPDTTYAFTHPYGTELVMTDGDGGVVANKKGFTEDIGCLAAPCDFSLALSSRVFTGFLKWDPSVAPAAPSGYLGDAATLHPVVGSPNNLFKIADATNTTTLASTNLFTVAGKKALPITTSHDVPATDGPIDFGSQMDGTTSAAQTVTITNNDPLNTVTITSASIIGPMLTEYGITANTCASLAPGASCTIGVTFTPALAVLGTRAAALSVAHSGLNSPVQVPLTGTSIGPIATMSTNNLGFGNQGLNVSSAPLTVTLSNTGTGPLMVASLAITPNFSVSATTCLFAPNTLASGASCTISIRFTPSVLGLRTGTLTVQSNAINGPQTVALSGTGIGVPVAPTGLTATAGNAQVSLTWNASVNATGYNVYRGTKKGGPYTKITPAPVTSTSFVSTGLANGTPYFFVVRAVNAVGEGLASAEATATPVAPPTAPTGLIATAGNAQVSLTWNAATGAATYNVKRSTTSGSGYQTIATGLTVRSFTDTGRTNGTTYFYVVTAVNAGGESGNSAQASATPAPQPPAAPTNLTATAGARGTLRIALSWTASAGATSYTIRRGTTRNGPYNTVVATGVTTTSFTNTGLINGTNYFYVVIAVNANGSSGNSNEATARAQ
jgi:fibronectin type 3 domain-containing protein